MVGVVDTLEGGPLLAVQRPEQEVIVPGFHIHVGRQRPDKGQQLVVRGLGAGARLRQRCVSLARDAVLLCHLAFASDTVGSLAS